VIVSINKAKKALRMVLIATLGLAVICLLVLLVNLTPIGRTTIAGGRSTKVDDTKVEAGTSGSLATTYKTPNAPSASAVDKAVDAGLTPITESDLRYLQSRNLLLPVAGISADKLHDTFNDARSEGRVHQALDIMASQGTPVLATADGTLKLHASARGGTMVYETDPSGVFVFCYGHLQRYADGIYDGRKVNRGDVIGYVGDTGNAGPGNYHLHFAIAKVQRGKWSGGEPINPFPLFSR